MINKLFFQIANTEVTTYSGETGYKCEDKKKKVCENN